MTLRLQKRKKFIDEDEYYYEYLTIEIASFRWYPNHVFEYVPVKSAICKHLEDDEEIVGLGI